MKSFHVKKNDEVVVLSGADKGKRGRIITILAKKDRVIVEGVAMIKRHTRMGARNRVADATARCSRSSPSSGSARCCSGTG